MKFEAYNYQCSPLSVEDGFFTKEAQEYREEALKAMDRHLEIIDEFMTTDKVDYPTGSGMATIPFKEGNVLRLIRKKVRKRKGVNDKIQAELTMPYLKALVLYAKECFYVLSVQNKTLLSKEKEWEKQYDINEPSCLVIIANTEGRQLLLVEANGAFGSSKKKSTQGVCNIFQDTLKALLMPHKLDVNFKPHYGTADVWDHLIEKYKMGIALKSLDFHFDYPNMAQDAQLLGSFFEEFGVELNAEMEYKIKGHHNQAINFDPREANRNPHLASIIEYGGDTGNKQIHTFMDNSKKSYDAKEVGISTMIATNKLEEQLKQLIKEAVEKEGKLDFDLTDFDNLRDDLAVWLNALKRRKTGTEDE